MTLFKALHPRVDINRLYVNRKMGGRDLLSIADVVRLEKHSLSVYVNKSKEPIMTKVRDHLLHNVCCDTISKSTILLNHVEQWRSKALHGQWPKLLEEIAADSFHWLQNCCLFISLVAELLLIHFVGCRIAADSFRWLQNCC